MTGDDKRCMVRCLQFPAVLASRIKFRRGWNLESGHGDATMAMVLNNRELALVAWTGVVLVWMLSRRDLRPPLVDLVKVVVQPVILMPLCALAAWVAGEAWLAVQVGAWEPALLNETVWWFLITGLVLYFGAAQLTTEDHFWRKTIKRVVTLGLLAEVFVNLVVLPFWAEFLLLPVATLVVTMSWFTRSKPEYAPAHKLFEWAASIIGLSLFAFVAISLISDPGQVDPAYIGRLLALPVWLTVFTLPLVFVFGLWLVYDKAFRMIGFWSEDKSQARRAKFLLLRRLNFRARWIGAFDGQWQRRLVRASDTEDRQAVISEFLQEQAAGA